MNEDVSALIERHQRWWAREATLITQVAGAPLGDLWLPLADGTLATRDMDLTPDLLDFERLLPGQDDADADGGVAIHGDIFRTTTAFGRVPWLEAILGAPVRATIQGGSMRTKPLVENWTDWSTVPAYRNDAWYALLLRLTEALVERAGGRAAVVQPTLRGPSDLAEALLGPELLSFSLYDHPAALRSFLEETTAVFVEVLHALLARIPPLAGGYVSPFGIWAPGTVVRTQCDASAFLSGRHYAEWFLPYDVRIAESVDYAFIHLHSCSLHTVDALLEMPRPQAIQVTLEAAPSGPLLQDMLPTFRQILAVKPLLLEGQLDDDDVALLLDALPTGGLAIIARRAAW